MGAKGSTFSRRDRLWTCFHTLIWATLALLLMRGDYTNRIYHQLAHFAVQPGMSGQQAVVAVTHTVHELINLRREIWGQPVGGLYARLFNSFSLELSTPQGACGSSSAVLVKALQSAGFRARYVQIKAGHIFGAHIMTEAEIEPGQWALLDASFDTHFVRPDGKLASFADVKNDPAYYLKQTPPNYAGPTEFSDARYTNWTKIPVVMPAIHWCLSKVMSSEQLDTLCLRAYISNYSYLEAGVIFGGYVVILLVRTILRRRKRGMGMPTSPPRGSDVIEAMPRLPARISALALEH